MSCCAAAARFHGDTAVETMRAILKEDPPPPDLPDSVPAVVRQMVIHCLEKEPGNRFQSARDLSFALSAMSQSSGGSSIQSGVAKALPGRSRWSKRAMIAAAALVLLAAGGAGGRLLWHTPTAPEWSGEILGGPETALDPRLSPDGSLLAFQAFDRGNTQVAVMKPGNRQLVDPDAQPRARLHHGPRLVGGRSVHLLRSAGGCSAGSPTASLCWAGDEHLGLWKTPELRSRSPMVLFW